MRLFATVWIISGAFFRSYVVPFSLAHHEKVEAMGKKKKAGSRMYFIKKANIAVSSFSASFSGQIGYEKVFLWRSRTTLLSQSLKLLRILQSGRNLAFMSNSLE